MPKIMKVSPTVNAVVLFLQLNDNVWKLMLEWAFEANDATILADYVKEDLRS